MSRLSLLVVGFLTLSSILSSAAWAGDISSPEDLLRISSGENLDSTYTLINDVDLATATGEVQLAADATSYIGLHGSTPFVGTFEGNGHKISGLIVPLFDSVGSGVPVNDFHSSSTVSSVTLLAANDELHKGVSGEGVLANTVNFDASVFDVHASGAVHSDYYAGGLVGWNEGLISNSSAAVDVGANTWAGGLVAFNLASGTVENSSSSGAVTNVGVNTGGLVGLNSGLIHDSASSSQVDGTSDFAGGLVGYNSGFGTILNSESSGDVHGHGENTGGLVGGNYGEIRNSFSSGAVLGEGIRVGGLSGVNFGQFR
jgi:The GLUG motif